MVKEVQMIQNRWFGWDTDYINRGLVDIGLDFLEHIDGSFACIWWFEGKLRVFRNVIVPLFYNQENGSLSSTNFKGADLIDDGTLYNYELATGKLIPEATFTNGENPYLL